MPVILLDLKMSFRRNIYGKTSGKNTSNFTQSISWINGLTVRLISQRPILWTQRWFAKEVGRKVSGILKVQGIDCEYRLETRLPILLKFRELPKKQMRIEHGIDTIAFPAWVSIIFSTI